MKIFYRQNNLFKIDKDILGGNVSEDAINALYAAAHEEFKGASTNPTYKNLTYIQRMEALNKFAENWLKQRGIL